jgi:bacillolysin
LITPTSIAGAKKDLRVRYHPTYKTASFIEENWTSLNRSVSPQQMIWEYLNARQNLFLFKGNAQDHFRLIDQTTDQLGMTHYRLQSIHHGIPVYGSEQTIHTKANRVYSFLGNVIPNISLPAIQKIKHISANEAIATAKKHASANQFLYEPKAHLVVLPHQNSFVYAYVIKLAYVAEQPKIVEYFIDATNGKIVNTINVLHHLTGEGKGVNGDTKTFEITKQGDTYYLTDSKRNNNSTYDAENQNENSPVIVGKLVSSKSTTFSDPSAVDAHYYAAQTYDFYKTTFNRNSFDNKGAKIKSYVHVGKNWNNAAWDGEKMIYGDGDGKEFRSLAGGLDVIAHEITHAVTQYTADLRYQYESGAINESISDIMGVMVDDDDWLIGEDVYTPNKEGDALRSMSEPTKYNQPDHYSKRYKGWQDNGGVHINSGINNKAAYLIAAGGTHYGITVKGIGREKTAQIYYRALTAYLTSTSKFIDMRDAAIQSAKDLYGVQSDAVTAVQKAYNAVGVK